MENLDNLALPQDASVNKCTDSLIDALRLTGHNVLEVNVH